MRMISLEFDFEKQVVTYEGQTLPIFDMLDADGDETDSAEDATLITFGDETFGYLCFDREEDAFVEVVNGELRFKYIPEGSLE